MTTLSLPLLSSLAALVLVVARLITTDTSTRFKWQTQTIVSAVGIDFDSLADSSLSAIPIAHK